jgi:hypothetical protein
MKKQAITLTLFFAGVALMLYGLGAFDWRLAATVGGAALAWSALRNM